MLRQFIVVSVGIVVAETLYAGGFAGKVVDPLDSGRGIPAVNVLVKTPKGELLQATQTDANGTYTLTGLPDEGQVVVYCIRDGWQARPTTRIFQLSAAVTKPRDIPMVSEQGSVAYYETFARTLASADGQVRRDLRAILFNLPRAKADIVAREFSIQTGDSMAKEHALYQSDLQIETVELNHLRSNESMRKEEHAEHKSQPLTPAVISGPAAVDKSGNAYTSSAVGAAGHGSETGLNTNVNIKSPSATASVTVTQSPATTVERTPAPAVVEMPAPVPVVVETPLTSDPGVESSPMQSSTSTTESATTTTVHSRHRRMRKD